MKPSLPAEAAVYTGRGEYRALARRWRNPLNNSVCIDLVQSDQYGRVVRSFPTQAKLDAWLSQRRWRRAEWSAAADFLQYEL